MKGKICSFVNLVLIIVMIVCGKNVFASSVLPLVPEYSKHDQGKVFRQAPPSHKDQKQFKELVFWLHAVTLRTDKVEKPARITVKQFYVYQLLKNGKVKFMESFPCHPPITENTGGLYPRIDGWSDTHKPILNTKLTRNGLLIDLSPYPKYWVHFWTNRIPYQPGAKYMAEMVVKVEGEARIQMGMDYWVKNAPYGRYGKDGKIIPGASGWDKDCEFVHNCEGSIGDWVGDTGGKFRSIYIYNY